MYVCGGHGVLWFDVCVRHMFVSVYLCKCAVNN